MASETPRSGAADGSRRPRTRQRRAAPEAGTGHTGRRHGCSCRGGYRRRLSRGVRITHGSPACGLYPRRKTNVEKFDRRPRYGRPIKDYYEDLWERLPADLEAPLLERRLEFLLDEVSAGDRVLDLGCGTGEFTAALAEADARPVGVDVAEAALSRARARHPSLDFRLVPFDGPLPFDDGSFELVWASEVIEHVADTARWLSEVRRVLVPAGRLLVTTPSHGRLRLLLGGVERFSEPLGDHLHLYTARSLRSLLHEFGFDEIRVRAEDGPPLLKRSLFARALRRRWPGR